MGSNEKIAEGKGWLREIKGISTEWTELFSLVHFLVV